MKTKSKNKPIVINNQKQNQRSIKINHKNLQPKIKLQNKPSETIHDQKQSKCYQGQHQLNKNPNTKSKNQLETAQIMLTNRNQKISLQAFTNKQRRKSSCLNQKRPSSRISNKRGSVVSSKTHKQNIKQIYKQNAKQNVKQSCKQSSKQSGKQNSKQNDKNNSNIARQTNKNSNHLNKSSKNHSQKKFNHEITSIKKSMNSQKSKKIIPSQLVTNQKGSKGKDLLIIKEKNKNLKKSQKFEKFQVKISKYLNQKDLFSHQFQNKQRPTLRQEFQKGQQETKKSQQNKDGNTKRFLSRIESKQKQNEVNQKRSLSRRQSKQKQNLLEIYQFYKKTFDININNCRKGSLTAKFDQTRQTSSKSSLRPSNSSMGIVKSRKQEKQININQSQNQKKKLEFQLNESIELKIKSNQLNASKNRQNSQNNAAYSNKKDHCKNDQIKQFKEPLKMNEKLKSLTRRQKQQYKKSINHSESSTKQNVYNLQRQQNNQNDSRVNHEKQDQSKIKSGKSLIFFHQKNIFNENKQLLNLKQAQQNLHVQFQQLKNVQIGQSSLDVLQWWTADQKNKDNAESNKLGPLLKTQSKIDGFNNFINSSKSINYGAYELNINDKLRNKKIEKKTIDADEKSKDSSANPQIRSKQNISINDQKFIFRIDQISTIGQTVQNKQLVKSPLKIQLFNPKIQSNSKVKLEQKSSLQQLSSISEIFQDNKDKQSEKDGQNVFKEKQKCFKRGYFLEEQDFQL